MFVLNTLLLSCFVIGLDAVGNPPGGWPCSGSTPAEQQAMCDNPCTNGNAHREDAGCPDNEPSKFDCWRCDPMQGQCYECRAICKVCDEVAPNEWGCRPMTEDELRRLPPQDDGECCNRECEDPDDGLPSTTTECDPNRHCKGGKVCELSPRQRHHVDEGPHSCINPPPNP